MDEKKVVLVAKVIEPLSIIALLFAFLFVIFNYHLMPDQVPAHFSFEGKVEGWETRTWSLVLMAPLIAAGVYIVSSVLILLLRYATMPQKMLILLEGDSEQLPKAWELRTYILRLLLIGKAFYVIMISALNYFVVSVALGQRAEINSLWGTVFIVGSLIFLFLLFNQSLKFLKTPR